MEPEARSSAHSQCCHSQCCQSAQQAGAQHSKAGKAGPHLSWDKTEVPPFSGCVVKYCLILSFENLQSKGYQGLRLPCDSLGPGFISKTGLSLEMSSMWFQLQSHEGYTSNGVMDIPQLLNRVTEPRQCMAGKCPHEGPKRARGPEKPLHEAEKVEPGLY